MQQQQNAITSKELQQQRRSYNNFCKSSRDFNAVVNDEMPNNCISSANIWSRAHEATAQTQRWLSGWHLGYYILTYMCVCAHMCRNDCATIGADWLYCFCCCCCHTADASSRKYTATLVQGSITLMMTLSIYLYAFLSACGSSAATDLLTLPRTCTYNMCLYVYIAAHWNEVVRYFYDMPMSR